MKIPLRAVVLVFLYVCLAAALCASLALGAVQCSRHFVLQKRTSEAAHGYSRPQTETEATLASTQVLAADPYDLASRLGRTTGPLPRATLTPAIRYALGAREEFWALDLDAAQAFQVSASLRHISPHLYMWVQDGLDVQQDALERSAEVFEKNLYPTVHRYFGSEWSPGIDNDMRLTVLSARFTGALGYFSSSDEYRSSAVPHSNQREMFYINPEQEQPGSTRYDATLTHEFQHMVHWHADPNEDAWVSEGASELAMHLCGYPRDDRITAFADHPDTQLNNWEAPPADLAPHYGASFLFWAYFAERFGPEMTRELVANKLNGIAGLNSVLRAHSVPLSFDDLFADWAVANYLDGQEVWIVGAPYLYEGLDVQARAESSISVYPAKGVGSVHQYATDYIELEPAGQDIELTFSGDTTNRLVPNQAHSGGYQWWSNRGDSSDMTLTRSFDLSGLKVASLQVWLWYDIEEGWDYAYVEASSDGGATWTILPGRYTTTEDPSGGSYGAGYTGKSCTGSTAAQCPEWVMESFDLSAFAGQQVLIRFEYLTDDAVNRPGLCLDDIRIPELGYSCDAEKGDDGWAARGFIRCDNTVPQRYIVQLIRLGDKTTVERLPLGIDQGATVEMRDFGAGVQRAVVIVSAATPGTDEVANYRYEIRPLK